MRIKDLINNPEFTFNVHFRILEYLDAFDDTLLIYDSESARTISDKVLNRWISAINTGDDGVIEIEYVPLIGE